MKSIPSLLSGARPPRGWDCIGCNNYRRKGRGGSRASIRLFGSAGQLPFSVRGIISQARSQRERERERESQPVNSGYEFPLFQLADPLSCSVSPLLSSLSSLPLLLPSFLLLDALYFFLYIYIYISTEERNSAIVARRNRLVIPWILRQRSAITSNPV